MTENEHKSTPTKMSKRKFIGLWAVAGQIFGMLISDQTYGFTGEVVAYKLGTGLPFALVGAAIGALAHYFFRSENK
jgi:hypothetical protein